MSTSLPPAFSLGPVSTLQEMLRTIAFVNRSLPFSVPPAGLTKKPWKR